MIGSADDFSRRLKRWYRKHRRDLPWRLPIGTTRGGKLDPYHVLVSEAMLQQTQVATVIPYFKRFIAQFPTLESLAQADTQQVLRAWQGLGYYSRARNLQKSAIAITSDFNGQVPHQVQQLLTLPGIGRYTAGAVSSIAFEQRSPILDGNVARVLCRIDSVRGDPRDVKARARLWERAEEILPQSGLGDFNSALMELGAMICTPRNPQCLICPVRVNCQAAADGLQDQIPPPKPAKKTLLHERWVFCIQNGNRFLVEQRPAKGRWAGMWQFVTVEAEQSPPSGEWLKLRFLVLTGEPVEIGIVEHALTHRRYRFTVFYCAASGKIDEKWVTLAELDDRPMPRPHLRIREMLAGK